MKNFTNIIEIKKNQRICIINMPVENRGELSSVPEGVVTTSHPVGTFHKMILFTNTKKELTAAWDRLMATLVDKGDFWIGYPNKGYKIYNEIDNEFIYELIEKKGVAVKDEVMLLPGWNGIKIEKKLLRSNG
jgi:hypothetical protein